LNDVLLRERNLHGLSRSAVSSIEQFANCRYSGILILYLPSQSPQFIDRGGRMLACQFLQFGENPRSAAGIATLAFAELHFDLADTHLFSDIPIFPLPYNPCL
jgi:hypothetical protein